MNSPVLPTPENKPSNAPLALKRLFRYVMRKKATLCILLIVTVIAIAFDIYMPLLIERCIDAIAGKGGFSIDLNRFFAAFIPLVVVIVLSMLLGWLHGFLSSRLNHTVAADFRSELFKKVMNMPLSDSGQYSNGDMMSRITNDSDLAASAFSEVLLSVMSDGIVIIGCAAVMFWRNALLAGVTIGASLLSVVLTALVSRVLFPAFFAQRTALGMLNTHIEESVSGFRSGILGGRKAKNRSLFEQYSRDLYSKNIKAAKLEGIMEPLMLLLGNINFLLIVVFGAKQVTAGVITLGLLQAFILYSRQFMAPVTELGGCFAKAQSALAAAERIFALLDYEDEADTPALPEHRNRIDTSAHLSLDNVSFAYQSSKTVLNGISMQIEKGDRLAIAGVTGAGKTTLVSLIMRLYDSYEGNIRLNGVNIREIGLRELRKRITLIPQDPQIITGTIFENIMYGSDEATREQALKASETVGLDSIVKALPQQYETRLQSNTAILSQGQLQLICLARALLRDAEILIMDESTSSMDASMEAELTYAMQAVMKEKTCILIAHRITSVPDAKHICVIEGGSVVQFVSNDRKQFESSDYYKKLLKNKLSE